ncbi:hypothetical protein FQN50_001285 [Emmonsiellopsis sp. PD_5]|nr:hypothetical protein FQN50_001285 [Emmonsiellopsis sp. PD_5]
MASKPGILPREGLYIDPIVSAFRKTILHPLFIVPASYLLRSQELDAFKKLEKPALFLAAASILLWANDYLSAKSRNNWTTDNSWNWKNEIVVVTGGSGGIGGSVAQRLVANGVRVVVVDIIPLTYEADDKRLTYYKCDLSDENEIKAVCKAIKSEVGHPSVLINNAGLTRGKTVAEGSHNDTSITLRTNLLAPFLLTKEFLPNMIKHNHGHIFSVSSMSAFIPPAQLADYAASKAGLVAFHESMALELKYRHNAPKVRTSMAVLGFTRTPLFKGETNQSKFVFPLLHVDTVGDAIVDILYSGRSRTIFLPGIFGYLAGLRGAPDWFQNLIRAGSEALRVDFKGRQKIDPATGKLI